MNLKVRALSIFTVGLALSLMSCSATKYKGRFYDGPELSKEKVATVIGADLGRFINNQSVYVCKVDDIKVEMSSNNSLDTLPGEHKFLVLYNGGNIQNTVELTFTVVAGHKYLITFDKKSVMEANLTNEFMLWVEDTATGEHVKDIKSSSLKSLYACF